MLRRWQPLRVLLSGGSARHSLPSSQQYVNKWPLHTPTAVDGASSLYLPCHWNLETVHACQGIHQELTFAAEPPYGRAGDRVYSQASPLSSMGPTSPEDTLRPPCQDVWRRSGLFSSRSRDLTGRKAFSRVNATSELPGSRWVVKRPGTKQIIFKTALNKQSEAVGFTERTLGK